MYERKPKTVKYGRKGESRKNRFLNLNNDRQSDYMGQEVQGVCGEIMEHFISLHGKEAYLYYTVFLVPYCIVLFSIVLYCTTLYFTL